jgi:hypothetical protein
VAAAIKNGAVVSGTTTAIATIVGAAVKTAGAAADCRSIA